MSTGVRVPIDEARPIAWSLIESLYYACERIEVAGSIRRGRPDVGDIELLAVSKTHEEQVPGGLFDGPQTVTVMDIALAVGELLAKGVLTGVDGHKADGERYIKSRHAASGLQVDLFIVRPPASWGVLHLIRTGPATYSQWVVTEARRRGFHVASAQLHRGSLGCGIAPCEVVPTPEEGDVFRALGIPPLRPEERS